MNNPADHFQFTHPSAKESRKVNLDVYPLCGFVNRGIDKPEEQSPTT